MMGRVIRRVVMGAFLCVAFCVVVAAQQQQQQQQRVPTNNGTRRVEPTTPRDITNAQGNVLPVNIDENFELNINERRITEADFYASTAIELGEASARGLSVRIGVAVGASEIDVLLRNVQGRVRFRASFDALRRVLDERHLTTPAQPGIP